MQKGAELEEVSKCKVVDVGLDEHQLPYVDLFVQNGLKIIQRLKSSRTRRSCTDAETGIRLLQFRQICRFY